MRVRWACALLGVLFAAAAPAQLTESEKQLLRGAMSAETARAAGKAADVEVLERIVALGDPQLVREFGYGLQSHSTYTIPAPVEAVVVKHFDHPKVGAALRNFQGRYASRALFDLHLERIRNAHRSDEPSFEQILRTQQPGIDEELLAVAPRFPVSRGASMSQLADFLGRRRHPGAVPMLLAALEQLGSQPRVVRSTALDLLLGYRSEEVWREADALVERLRRDGKITDAQYTQARRQLDPMMADPAAALARLRSMDTMEAYYQRRHALSSQAQAKELSELYKTSPREYIAARERYLEADEALAREFNDERIDYQLAANWGHLGVYTRFLANDPKLAVRYFERAAKGRDLVGQVLLADTHQLALRDKPAALKAYQRALDTASRQPAGSTITPYASRGSPMNEFWKAWFAAEIEFLRTGKVFRGRVPEPVIAGFWEVLGVWLHSPANAIPGFPMPMEAMTGASRYPAAAPAAPTWQRIESFLERIDRPKIAARLKEAPASRWALLVTLRHISTQPQAKTILDELARSDPSGYWTTIVMGTVAFHESSPARREEALANGVAEALPGMALPGKPNALALAARRHLREQALRVVEKKP